jgi:hypothetical protein
MSGFDNEGTVYSITPFPSQSSKAFVEIEIDSLIETPLTSIVNHYPAKVFGSELGNLES